MNILFYTPLNSRCRDIESQAEIFSESGHEIFLLTQSEQGALHNNFATYGYHVFASKSISKNKIFRLLKQLYYFISICRNKKIDLVYSHLEPANFIAVLGQFFIPSQVIICRHHSDEAGLYGVDRDFSYRTTYRLAKKIIVVSEHAKKYMIEHEGIPSEKIICIPLSYDFNLYSLPNEKNVSIIKKKYDAEILLLSVGRLTTYKRVELTIDVANSLVKEGLHVKLIILGFGETFDQLQEIISSKQLQQKVFLAGHVDNVLDYMAASDFLIHPSLSESSCISVKEAALVRLPVIVSEGIGDFNEYIVNGFNGFKVDRNDFVHCCSAIIKKIIMDKTLKDQVGQNLKKSVLERFDIKKIAYLYDQIHKQIKSCK